MGKRRLARELAVKVLFHLEFSTNDPSQVFNLICDNFSSKETSRPFAKQLVLGVCEKKTELDAMVRNASRNWRIERMSKLDRCILRLATYELVFLPDVPPKVSIDEALEIGKKFGTEDSCRFINGILDNIYNSLMEQGKLKHEE